MNIELSKTSKKSITLEDKHSLIGQEMDQSDVCDSMELENVSSTSGTSNERLVCPNNQHRDSLSFTQESLRPNKRTRSQLNETNSWQPTQTTTESSPTLGQVLTLKDEGCNTFWNSSAKDWSNELWSCTKTDLQKSNLTSLNESVQCLVQNSWYTVRIQKTTTANTTTLSQSSHVLLHHIMEDVRQRTEKEEEKEQEESEKKKQKIDKDNERRRLKRQHGMSDEDIALIGTYTDQKRDWESKLVTFDTNPVGICGITKAQIRGKIKRCENAISRVFAKYKPVKVPSKNKLKKSKPETVQRVKKIKFSPNDQDRNTIKQMIGTSRFVYNQCVARYYELLKTEEGKKVLDQPITVLKQVFRDHIKLTVMNEKGREWLKDMSLFVIDESIIDFIKAYSSNLAIRREKEKQGKKHKFKMKFKSLNHMVQQRLRIGAREWNQTPKGYFGFLKLMTPKTKEEETTGKSTTTEELPSDVKNEVTIVVNRFGEHYFHFVTETKVNNDEPFYNVISLDPGVRTFMTGYDSNGRVVELGKDDVGGIYSRLKYADGIKSKMDAEKNNPSRKKRLRRAYLRALLRIRRRINDFHRKMCLFLCRSYKVIILPEFQSKRMSEKSLRKISSATVRKMMTWGHFRFRELLKAKVKTFSKCTLIICDEDYTSKTCGSCGELHQKLGKKKTFRCPTCRNTSDRDVNAARNILIRFLTVNSISLFSNPTRESLGGLARASLFRL